MHDPGENIEGLARTTVQVKRVRTGSPSSTVSKAGSNRSAKRCSSKPPMLSGRRWSMLDAPSPGRRGRSPKPLEIRDLHSASTYRRNWRQIQLGHQEIYHTTKFPVTR